MCQYNGLRIGQHTAVKLMDIKKDTTNIRINRVQSGLDYRDWPVIFPVNGGADFEIKSIHWEYIPSIVHDEHELFEARIMNHWLNVKGENLLKNDRGRASLFREGALYGRCLVLSSGFYEYRHVPKTGRQGKPLKQTQKIPYYITLTNEQEYFFMAGIHRLWTNQSRNQSAETFAIVTTAANELMQKVNNTKLRMPVILPEKDAIRWLKDGLSEKEIMELGTYSYPAAEMRCWPVAKDFITNENPEEECSYEHLPDL